MKYLGTRKDASCMLISHQLLVITPTLASLNILHYILSLSSNRRNQQTVGVGNRTVCANLSQTPREDAELRHLDHGSHKLLEEQGLIHGEGDDSRLSSGIGVEVLVGREEALAVHEVDVVLVVELVGGADVEHGGVGGVGGGAGGFEVVGECFVHHRVLSRVEAAGEGGAVADADGVAARQSDHVRRREVLRRQGSQDDGGVARRRR